jgi:membrane protease YdiL (CAAX protease family)
VSENPLAEGPFEPAAEAGGGVFQSVVEPLLAMLLAVSLTLLASLLLLPIPLEEELDLLDLDPRMLPALLAIQAVALLLVGGVLVRIRVRSALPARTSVPGALLFGVGAGGAALLASVVIGATLEALGLPVEEQEWLTRLFTEPQTVIWIAPWLVLVGPLAEEVFFRRYAYRVIAKRNGPRVGLLISSAMFAAVHFNLSGIAIYFVIGVALAWVYERTGRMLAPVVAHVTVNAVVLSVALMGSPS